MIIDVNGYYGVWPYWPLRSGDVGSILAVMDRVGINQVCVSSLKAVFSDPKAGNEEIKELMRRHPARFYPALTYSPYASGKEDYRFDWENDLSGLVKLFPLQHTYDPLEEPFIQKLLQFCGEKHIPVMIPYRLMMSWRFPTFDLKRIAALAQRFPEVRFIIASINYLSELQTALHTMHQYNNVYVETSGMMAFREIEFVVGRVGADRILHGSCIPLQNAAIGPLKIKKADIPEEAKNRIFYFNAAYLLNGSGQKDIGIIPNDKE